MIFFDYLKPKVLIAEEGMQLRDKRDVYQEGYTDENGVEISEHVPNYFQILFITSDEIDSLEKCQEKYVEEKI